MAYKFKNDSLNTTQEKDKVNPKVSIGMPIFNGERFLPIGIESLLSQTYTDFELIISDNASTDSTSTICKEYSKKDKRIRYFRQEKNMGLNWNYRFVLQEAKYDYFMWAAVDDIRKPEFLEKNLYGLLSNRNAVCSMSRINFYGIKQISSKYNKRDLAFRNLRKKIRYTLKPRGIYPISGSYQKKIRFFLNKSEPLIIFGLFRTEELRKSLINETFIEANVGIILNVLKFGDIDRIDEVLMQVFDMGISNRGIINLSKKLNHGVLGMMFPYYPLTSWCFRNLGPKLFFKNIDCFILTNLWGLFSQLMDLARIFSGLPRGKSKILE